ncbi:MAG TPA: hypothetical protein VEB21_14065, partial [Terriglobales bacterium]|nr:hypothetical protein [Terriglobales bacterium]
VLEIAVTVTNIGSAFESYDIEMVPPEGTLQFPRASSVSAQCVSAAFNQQCVPREPVHFRVSLQPGSSSTFRIPPQVAMNTADGTALRVHVRAGLASGRDVTLNRTVVVDAETPFDLSVNDSLDPVGQGQMLTYTIDYGRVAETASGDATLRFELPPEVSFANAGDGGMLVNDTAVEWDLGTVAAGAGDSRQVTVLVDSFALDGAILRGRATISDAADFSSEKRSEVVTVVRGQQSLVLDVNVEPDPATAGQAVTVTLALTNKGSSTLNNVLVNGIVPPEANAFNDNLTTGGGRCGAFSFNACNPRDLVLFVVPSITPGQTVEMTMPPVPRADLPPGTVVRFVAAVQEFSSQVLRLASDAVVIAP